MTYLIYPLRHWQIFRKAALIKVRDKTASIVVDSSNLRDFVGTPIFTTYAAMGRVERIDGVFFLLWKQPCEVE